jgi:hypothetical protein
VRALFFWPLGGALALTALLGLGHASAGLASIVPKGLSA